MITKTYRMRDGHIVVTGTSDFGVAATLKMTRQQAGELRDQLDAKLQRSASIDWDEPLVDEDEDKGLAQDMRHMVSATYDGVEVRLGTMDDVRALAQWDEKTAKRIYKELGVHVQNLASGVILSFEAEVLKQTEREARQKQAGEGLPRAQEVALRAAEAAGMLQEAGKNGGG